MAFDTPEDPPAEGKTFDGDAYVDAFTGVFHITNVPEDALPPGIGAGAYGGAITRPYTFDSTTTDSDPGSGNLRLDNATQNTSTVIRVDLVDADGATVTSILDTFDDSTSTVKGFIRLVKADDLTAWILFSVTSLASPSGYKNITVSHVSSSTASPFTNGDNLLLHFDRNGDAGPTGPGATPATGSENGFLSRTVYVNASSTHVGTTFAGVEVEAAPASWMTDADIPDGTWVIVDVVGAGGGGSGANAAEGQSGSGGGGGARRREIYSRAELISMLPIPIVCGLGGAGGVGRHTDNSVVIVTQTAGANGSSSSSFGPLVAGAGSGGQVSTGRHAGTGGGFDSAPTPAASTAAQLGGAPAQTIGAAGLYLEGAGHNATSGSSATGTPGSAAVWGGASGGSANPPGSGFAAGAGGRAVYGGGGGASGGSCATGTIGSGGTGGVGGGRWVSSTQSGAGGAGGAGGITDGVAASVGSPGNGGDALVNGDGGGGGGAHAGNVTTSIGGAGGAGGFPGGGGGGGGATRLIAFSARVCIGGDGGDGGDGLVMITAFA